MRQSLVWDRSSYLGIIDKINSIIIFHSFILQQQWEQRDKTCTSIYIHTTYYRETMITELMKVLVMLVRLTARAGPVHVRLMASIAQCSPSRPPPGQCWPGRVRLGHMLPGRGCCSVSTLRGYWAWVEGTGLTRTLHHYLQGLDINISPESWDGETSEFSSQDGPNTPGEMGDRTW